MTIKFFKHQKENIAFKLKQPRSFDTSTCGTGKTLSTLEAWKQRKHNKKLLVVAPKSTLEAVWYNDTKKLIPDAKVGWFSRYQQSKNSKYINQLFDQNDITIINIEAVDLVLEHVDLSKYTDLVIDEFTCIKNRNAQRSINVNKLSNHFENIHLLSGTPTPNGIVDIWHPAYILDHGQRLGSNFYDFRNIVCKPVLKGNVFRSFTEWEELPGAIEEVGEILRDITIRHVLEDVVDMPDRVYVNRIITMPDKLRKMYEKMKKEALLEFEKTEITAVNKAVLGQKLLQIASGSAYTQDGIGQLLDTNKYELIVEMVEERPASLVFFQWQHQRDALKKILIKKKIDYETIDGSVKQDKRSRIIRDYQTGKYRTLLIQPAAAAHGITLTRSVASIWCSPTFNLEHFLQANHRDYRIGQLKRTEVIMVQYRDTIEEHVYQILKNKGKNLNNLLTILKSGN